jgi:phosphoglucosamine mutase
LTDHSTTGDGLVAGLQVLAAMVEADQPASKLLRQFEPLPQLLKNVRFSGKSPLEADSVQSAIAAGEKALGKKGRLLIRKSGTEPLIRVMAEGEDRSQIEQIVDSICDAVVSAA